MSRVASEVRDKTFNSDDQYFRCWTSALTNSTLALKGTCICRFTHTVQYYHWRTSGCSFEWGFYGSWQPWPSASAHTRAYSRKWTFFRNTKFAATGMDKLGIHISRLKYDVFLWQLKTLEAPTLNFLPKKRRMFSFSHLLRFTSIISYFLLLSIRWQIFIQFFSDFPLYPTLQKLGCSWASWSFSSTTWTARLTSLPG